VSLALNALVLRLVNVDWVGIHASKSEVRPVALAPLSASQWAANRAVGASTAPRVAAPPIAAPRPLEPQSPVPGQVVEVAPSRDSTPPKNARFLSDRDNTVEKETRSRHARAGYEQTLPAPSQRQTPTPPQAPAEAKAAAAGDPRRPGAPGAPGQAAAERPAPLRSSQPRSPDGQKVAMAVDPEGPVRATEPARPEIPAPASPQGAGGQGGEGGPPNARPGAVLSPSAAFYDKLSGGPAPDHLEGVDVGESTFLNTREWKYASYFNRIKQAVASAWDPSSALRARDPSGERFAYKDRTTILAVTLNGEGALTDVRVQRSSGVDFLDRTCVEAFERAQPFVNPPRGLADSGGVIKFTFGFYLEVGSPGMRLFRGPPSP
jgi:TonB family protein